MKALSTMTAAILFLAGVALAESGPVNAPAKKIKKMSKPLVSLSQPIAAPQLICSPKSFTRDGLLNLELGLLHPGEMAIVRPDGEYFFIAQRVLGNSSIKAIPSDIFRNFVSLKISPKSFVAHRFRVGATDYELVFNKIGTYKVILGDSLESDVEGNAQICEITLTN